jgi:hypothetical protein
MNFIPKNQQTRGHSFSRENAASREVAGCVGYYRFFFLWRIFLRRFFLLCVAILCRFLFLPLGMDPPSFCYG